MQTMEMKVLRKIERIIDRTRNEEIRVRLKMTSNINEIEITSKMAWTFIKNGRVQVC